MKNKLLLLTICLGTAASAHCQTKTLQSVAPFPIGAAIAPELLANNNAYRRVVDEQFSSLTTENVLKWPQVHPAQNRFDFTWADSAVDYAGLHHKRVHGHCLAWHEAIPGWLTKFGGDSATWERLLKTHIATVVGRYKGKITSWDVVNEAFKDDGQYRGGGVNNEKGSSIWVKHLGTGYIARAFTYAHAADPQALLFYNEYGQESNEAKLKAVIAMVNDFKTRGIPIDGLGLQMHINIKTSKQGIISAFKQYAATGLLIHVSELDICVNPKNDPKLTYTDSLQTAQAQMYAFVVSQYKLLIPKKQQYGITLWNFSDADSWITKWLKKNDWPLLFDTNYQKKRCYDAFMNALQK